MKKMIVLILFSFLLLSCVPQPLKLTVTWKYKNPPPDLAGFYLYTNKKLEKVIHNPQARSCSYTCKFCVRGNNNVTITAFDNAGQESEPSKPLIVKWNP